MIYWLLFKRSFRSFPLFFTMYFIAIASFLVALYVKPHYTVYFFGFLSFLCGLALCPMVYVVCRKSTLMVPDFKRINANFYIFSGLLIVYLFLLSLIPNLGKGSINPVYLFLLYMGTGFFIYGLLLFTIPFLRKYFFLFFLH